MSTFGADVLLPVKLFDEYSGSARAAILTMVLGFQLPLETAKAMTKTLLDVGASSAQSDMNQTTPLHYAVRDRKTDILDVLFEDDAPAARSVVNHLALAGSPWYSVPESPLTAAIKVRDEEAISKLLSFGASPVTTFENYIKTSSHSTRGGWFNVENTELNRTRYQQTLKQPLELSLLFELPSTGMELVRLSTNSENLCLTAEGHLAATPGSWQRYTHARTMLGLVRAKLKKLRSYKGTEEAGRSPPLELLTDQHYLGAFPKNSYRNWSASIALQSAKKNYQTELEQHNERVERAKKAVVWETEKMESIQALINDFENIEKFLIEKGAKTWSELYPDKPLLSPEEPAKFSSPEKKPFEVSFNFTIPDLDDAKREGYLEL